MKQLKEANPSGRFWIKLDGTDVESALMESMRKEWNGDVNLGDGKLQVLRSQYEARLLLAKETPKAVTRQTLEQNIIKIIEDVEDDITFLASGLGKAIELFRAKMRIATTRGKP